MKDKIKKHIEKYKYQLMIVGAFGIGVAAGFLFGYKKYGLINTIDDPFTRATILTKRPLTDKELEHLADLIFNHGYNTMNGLEEMGLLFKQR